MNSFLSISLWIALATIIPGMMTIAAIFGAIEIVIPGVSMVDHDAVNDNFIWLSISITIMILTQSFGILLERLFVKLKVYGRKPYKIKLPKGFSKCDEDLCEVNSTFEYNHLYLLLIRLREDEDSQGHLKRCLAQFFLTNNSLVSFLIGIISTLILIFKYPNCNPVLSWTYFGGLLFFLIVSYFVAKIRFDIMIKALWATRNLRNL
ncbi:MAG TPA: hypothetical protein VIN10_06870 [Bacteroidales bacterium]